MACTTSGKDINLEQVGTGSVRRFRVTIKKDGVVWDLSTGSVVFRFEKPNRTSTFDRNATPEDATNGIFYYDTIVSDIDTPGQWTISIQVTDGTTIVWYPYEISFRAVNP